MATTKGGTRPWPTPPSPILITSLLILAVLIYDTILLTRISNALEDRTGDLNNQLPGGKTIGGVAEQERSFQ